jgi:hypothetical protein
MPPTELRTNHVEYRIFSSSKTSINSESPPLDYTQDMAERVLYNNHDAPTFPYEVICSTFSQNLTESLRTLEREDISEPRAGFAAALNIVLVWCGARTATLPSWVCLDPARVYEFIDSINKISVRCPVHCGLIDEVYVLKRYETYKTGEGIKHGLVVRRHSPRVRFDTSVPITDEDIGRELDMFHLNAYYFANGYDVYHSVFSIWEAGSHALVYAEIWNPDLFDQVQMGEFLVHCEKRVNLWNSSMGQLGLGYRFYGSFERFSRDSPWEHTDVTASFYGKPYFGIKHRDIDFPDISAVRSTPDLQKTAKTRLYAAA